jgi:short-subunit dehydrogenase
MSQSSTVNSILITGASSGIGAALAERYARSGRSLALQGRNRERLDAVASICNAKGATTTTKSIDVTDGDAMEAWITEVDQGTPIDLVIANAGISGLGDHDPNPVRTLFRVNVEGVLNTVQPIIPAMTKRGQGHLAFMSSLAGFRGLPTVPAYAASKAAVRSYGEGLRGALLRYGIAVSVICPGFVRTPMTGENQFSMPLLMEPEEAAAIIEKGLSKKAARIAFPLRLYLAIRLLSAMPQAWTDPLLQRFQGKE